MNLKFFCASFLFCALFYSVQSQAGASIRTALKKAQVVGSTSTTIGNGLNNGVVNSLRNNKRVAPYDMATGKFQTTPTSNQIENFNFTSQDSTASTTALNQAINYAEGVGMYGLLGVIFFLLTVIWIFPFIGMWCYGCCMCACCKMKRPIDDMTNYQQRINICRGIITGYIVLVVILLIPWTILTWQANQDVSNVIDSGVAQSYTFQNFIYNGLSITDNVTDLMDVVKIGLNNIAPTVTSILPIDNITLCLNKVTTGLPNATIMLAFINKAEASINGLPDLNAISANLQAVPQNISTIQSGTFSPLYNDFTGISQSVATIATKLTSLLAQLTLARQYYTVDITATLAIANQFMTTMTGALSTVNLNDYKTSFSTPALNTNAASAQLTKLNQFQAGLTAMNGYDLNTLVTNLGLLTQLKEQSLASSLQASINSVIAAQNNINFTLAQQQLNDYNSSLAGVFGNIHSMFQQLKNMSSSVGLFPSPTVLTGELSKVNDTISNLGCVGGVIESIRTINQTIIQLSSSISNAVNQFGDVQSIASKLNVSAIPTSALTDIGAKMVSVQPQIDSMAGNFSDIIGQLSTVATQSNMDLSAADYSTLFNAYSTSATKTDMDSYATQQVNLKNFTDRATWVSGVQSSVSGVNIGLFAAKIAEISAVSPQSNPCSGCQASDYAFLVSGADAILAAFAVATDAGAGFVGELTAEQTAVNALPNITANHENTKAAVQTNSVTIATVSADVIATMVNLTIQNVSLVVLQTLPYSDVSPIIAPVQSQISSAQPMFSQAKTLIGDFKSQTDSIANNNPVSQISSITDSFSKFGNMSDMLSSVTSGLNSTLSGVNKTINTIFGYRDQYAPMVYEYDGYRILVLAILILLPIFIPLSSSFAVCCPKLPCWLVWNALIKLIIALLMFVLVAVLLPANVLIGDTCEHVEVYVNTFAATQLSSMNIDLGGQKLDFSKPISIQQSIAGLNFSLSANVSEVLNAYLSSKGCSSNDAVSTLFASVTDQLSNLSTGVGNMVNDQLAPQGFVLLPGGFKLVNTVLGPIIGNATKLVNGVSGLVGCNNINSLYTSTKSIACGTANNVVATLNLACLLLGLLFLFGSIFTTSAYCFMVKNRVEVFKGDDEAGMVNTPSGDPNVIEMDETNRVQYDPHY